MDALLAHLLDAAGRAPSAHNTQPWRLRWRGDAIEVTVPEARRLPAADASGADLLHGLGALIENLLRTLAQRGLEGHYEVTDRAPVVLVRWRATAAPRPDATLYRMIPVRRTSRLPYAPRPVPAPALEAMRRAAEPACALRVLTDAARILEVRRLVARATAQQLGDPAIARELYAWMRFTPRDPRWYRDGLNAACLGLGRLESALARWLLAPPVLGPLARIGLHRALFASADQQAPPAPALCLLTASGEDGMAQRIEAGRSLQRAWLAAAAHGLVTHPLSAALDVAAVRPRTLAAFGVTGAEWPVNLFRLGESAPPARSPRLPADELLEG